MLTYLAMRELMQQPPLLHILDVHDHVPVSATTSRDHYVLVERDENEDGKGKEVDDGANGTHALGQVLCAGTIDLGQVAALEAGADEDGTQPADHGIAGGEGEATEA